MRSRSGMLPSRGVSGTRVNLEWGGAGDEAALQLFNKPTPCSVQNHHPPLYFAPLTCSDLSLPCNWITPAMMPVTTLTF